MEILTCKKCGSDIHEVGFIDTVYPFYQYDKDTKEFKADIITSSDCPYTCGNCYEELDRDTVDILLRNRIEFITNN